MFADDVIELLWQCKSKFGDWCCMCLASSVPNAPLKPRESRKKLKNGDWRHLHGHACAESMFGGGKTGKAKEFVMSGNSSHPRLRQLLGSSIGLYGPATSSCKKRHARKNIAREQDCIVCTWHV
jgi:hypothetical protein